MELYKICSKKLFLFSAMASLAILLMFFWSNVTGAESTINGVKYTGYQAIKMDREITEAFQGVLTDEKVAQIVDKYGFPSGVSENARVFLDKNYLNDFVMLGFSDGYFRDIGDYHVGTCVYPIAETELGKACAATGKPLLLEYSYGWKVFTDVLQTGCILGLALVLLALSPVFSEESAVNTRQILFTTKEGASKDVIAKIAAGMTITVGVYAVVVLLDLMLSWCVFGLDGLDCFYGQVMNENYIIDMYNYHNPSTGSMRKFLFYFIFSSFLGIIETGAISLYFSARCKSSFQSMAAAAASMLIPLLLFVLSQDSVSFLFIVLNLFPLLLLGIALVSFVPDFGSKGYSIIVKTLCCGTLAAMGYFVRRRFLFYITLPIWMTTEGLYWDMMTWKMRYPWMPPAIIGFTVMAITVYIVCSWKKYRHL